MAGPEPNLRDLFGEALQWRTPEEQSAYLAHACHGDAPLRARVEELLQAHREAGSFLGEPSASRAATIDLAPPAEVPGTVVGPYKLLEQIGEGGFGVVFLAEQSEPVRRKVALKVLKPGMGTRQVVARFEAERQALAMMDHPHIAHILEGGTTPAGRPFFAMELVRGLPITEHCDHRQLSVRDRLGLFVLVCQAVQHAHTKAVIHRDLKPSNVLVADQDGTAVPKVIDFGVAKALGRELTDKTLFTGVVQMVGTPLYMSPEQAGPGGQDVDTRGDIYSLGVLLYELLTGTTPFDRDRLRAAGYDEMRRIIREEEPAKPSSRVSTLGEVASTVSEHRGSDPRRLTRLLRGELDWVVMKCLEKDPDRRYDTVAALARDVERYLTDEAVQACPPSGGYRLRKFARRNRGRLTAGAVVGLALVLAIGALGWGVRDRAARHADAARERSERQGRHAAQVTTILADVERLQQANQWAAALALGLRAEDAVAGGDADEETRDRVRRVLADLRFVARLEQIQQIHDDYMKRPNNENDRQAAAEYARAFRDLDIDVELLTVEEAAARLRKHPAIASPVAAALDDWDVARRRDRLGEKLVGIAREIDADPLRRQIRECRLRIPTPQAQAEEYRRLAAAVVAHEETPQTLRLLADGLDWTGATDEALQVRRAACAAHPNDVGINTALAFCLDRKKDREAGRYFTAAAALSPDYWPAQNNLWGWLHFNGQYAEAEACARRMIRLDPKSMIGHSLLSVTLHMLQRYEEAADSARRAIAADPNAGSCHCALGQSLLALKRPAEVIPHLREATRLGAKCYFTFEEIARLLEQEGQLTEALEARREAVRLNPTLAGVRALAAVYGAAGQWANAAAEYGRAVELAPEDLSFRYFAALAHAAAGQWANAAAEYGRAVELYQAEPNYRYFAALAHAAAGQLDDYRRVCGTMLAKYAGTDQIQAAERTASACLLVAGQLSAEDAERVQKLAERNVTGTEKDRNFRFLARTKGLADYRAGRYKEAVGRIGQYAPDGTGLSADVVAYAVLALAQHRLGQAEEATRALNRARDLLTKRPDPKKGRPYSWVNSNGWMYAELLYREAESLVQQKRD